jgi:ubiquinone/menaquinone biosynthesis C-methylase UbiE
VVGQTVVTNYEDFWRNQPRNPEPWRYSWRRTMLEHELRAGETWLDLGCGAGRFLDVAPEGIGVDVAESALERARENVPGCDVRLSEDGTIPVTHGSIDFVWCSETIEHVADALGLLQEVRRVLKPGGRLLLTTPSHSLLRRISIAALRFDRHFDPMGQHVRFFSRNSLAQTLEAAGLENAGVRARYGTLIARGIRP